MIADVEELLRTTGRRYAYTVDLRERHVDVQVQLRWWQRLVVALLGIDDNTAACEAALRLRLVEAGYTLRFRVVDP